MNKEKEFKSFWAGIFFMIIGFYLIFIKHSNIGFIPSILGAIILYWKQDGK